MKNPAAHQVHGVPLADRLAADTVRRWLDRHAAISAASVEPEAVAGVDRLRQSLDDYWYTLVPALLNDLYKAALMTKRVSL
jgi:hypothetical protein